MKRSTTLGLIGLVAGSALACATEEAPQASADELAMAAHEDSMQTAMTAYDATAFDTVSWDDNAARHARGEVVFQISCSKCHGLEGLGDAGFVQRGDTLRPPSFVGPDWKFADDLDGLRQQIYTGTADGMPHWGLHGLKYRDVDAVAGYIREVLRSE